MPLCSTGSINSFVPVTEYTNDTHLYTRDIKPNTFIVCLCLMCNAGRKNAYKLENLYLKIKSRTSVLKVIENNLKRNKKMLNIAYGSCIQNKNNSYKKQLSTISMLM